MKQKKILITGGTGFLGKNLIPKLMQLDYEVDFFNSTQFDLSKENEAEKCFMFFNKKYDYIIHAAAVQGAADYPLKHKAEQFDLNIKIHTNVLKYWHKYHQESKLIGIGSSCSYPGIKNILYENEYWDGPMHESVDIYGLTKKILSSGIEAYKHQYGLKGTTVMFATLYGPFDCFDPDKSHVVSALIKKFVDAKDNDEKEVEIWGDGEQTRELIYVDDQINGLLTVLDYNGDLINIGTGISHKIKDLAYLIKKIVDYKGDIIFNINKFVGIKHKVLNIDKAKQLYGWTEVIKLDTIENNLKKTIDWYIKNK